MSSEAARQTVQAGLGTTPDRGIIQSLWVEIPGNCDLQCPYCFCATTKNKPDLDSNNLACVDSEHPERYSVEPYVKFVLKPFAERIEEWNAATPDERIAKFGCPPENAQTAEPIRGKVALPGAGEPFHPGNMALTKALIEACRDLHLHVTLFTTGHWITDELADWLKERDVVLLVKCNSRQETVQNRFVGMAPDHDFARKRDQVLEMLIDKGFAGLGNRDDADYREPRLGIVTSVMRDNRTELPDLLRYARQPRGKSDRHTLIFDCDTILERGRGDRCPQIPADDETRAAFMELQRIDREEFRQQWDISRSYIGTTCDRFQHHLYVDKKGNIYPCVGCLGEENDQHAPPVLLGNLKGDSAALYGAWESPLMKNVIRKRVYTGPCATCVNPIEHKCYSCLGRCRDLAVALDPNSEAPIPTTGCWNHRPLPVLLCDRAKALRNALRPKTERPADQECRALTLIEEGRLEELWMPREGTPRWLWKDVVLPELRRPRQNGLDPACDWGRTKCFCAPDADSGECRAHELLARCFVAPLQTLFELPEGGQDLLWVTLMLFDEHSGRYTFRTLSRFERDSDDEAALLLLYRIAETAYGPEGIFDDKQGQILDFTDYVRRIESSHEADCCLLFVGDDEVQSGPGSSMALPVFPVPDLDAIRHRAANLRHELLELTRNRGEMLDDLARLIVDPQSKAAAPSTGSAGNVVRFMTEEVRTKIEEYLYDETSSMDEDTKMHTRVFLSNVHKHLAAGNATENQNEAGSPSPLDPYRIVNYFIWLRALHPELRSYTVRYVPNYRVRLQDERQDRPLLPSGIVLASRAGPSEALCAQAEVILSYVLGPLSDQYALKAWSKQAAQAEWRDMVRGVTHHIGNALLPIKVIAETLDDQRQRRLQTYVSSLWYWSQTILALADEERLKRGEWRRDPQPLSEIVTRALVDALLRFLDGLGREQAGAWDLPPELPDRVDLQLEVIQSGNGQFEQIQTCTTKLHGRLQCSPANWPNRALLLPDLFHGIVLETVINAFRGAGRAGQGNAQVRVRVLRGREGSLIVRVANSAASIDAERYCAADDTRPGHHTGGVGITFLRQITGKVGLDFRTSMYRQKGQCWVRSDLVIPRNWDVSRGKELPDE